MIIIQNVLIHEDIVKQQFLCNLNACKGACCWEGDYGAPLEKEELQTLIHIYRHIASFLREEGRAAIEAEGPYVYVEEAKQFSTTLLSSGACAFMVYDKKGIAKCGIEQAYNAGATSFKKPISCHLYPIRVSKNKQTGFEMINYDQWEICSAACSLGEKEQMPVYKFVKEALIRKYGPDFYEALDVTANRV